MTHRSSIIASPVFLKMEAEKFELTKRQMRLLSKLNRDFRKVNRTFKKFEKSSEEKVGLIILLDSEKGSLHHEVLGSNEVLEKTATNAKNTMTFFLDFDEYRKKCFGNKNGN